MKLLIICLTSNQTNAYYQLRLIFVFVFVFVVFRVLIDKETPWNVIYDFIFDRLRAVRQDISIQCINDTDSLSIFERIVRFHIYAAYRYVDLFD